MTIRSAWPVSQEIIRRQGQGQNPSAEQEEKLLSLSYGDSGVNYRCGNYAVELIKPHVKNTRIPGVMET